MTRSRDLRICFATTEFPPHPGGAARSAHRLVVGLAKSGFDIAIFTPLLAGEVSTVIEQSVDGVKTFRVPFNLEAAADAIRQEDQRRPFNLFHGFTLLAAYPCLEVASRGNRPVLASIRGIDGLSFDDLTADVLKRSSWITSVSSDSLARAKAITDISTYSSVIPNGVDMRRFSRWKPTPLNRGVVGTVATFRPKKNIPLLIRSYSCLPKEIRRRLLLVGDSFGAEASLNNLGKQLDEVIRELGIKTEVEFAGFIDNEHLSIYHHRMHVFVLSSDHEGMPNAILEAAASGLPIVATAVDGVKDIFTNGKNALLIEPGNLDQLSEAIKHVIVNEDLACHLSEGARITASCLTPERELQGYAELYYCLLK
jgi:glycosyltransferase involved in cell wall biosynthesis